MTVRHLRVETPVLGYDWGQVVDLDDADALVAALIGAHRFTVVPGTPGAAQIYRPTQVIWSQTTPDVTYLTDGMVWASLGGFAVLLSGSWVSISGGGGSSSVPGAPTGLTATAGSGQAALSWTVPVVAGTSAITDYVVQYSSNGGSSWVTFADGVSSNTTATVTGLTNGTAYIFRVAAVSSVGTGSYSSSSSAVTPVASTVPGAPTSVTASGGNALATVSWTAPASNGGAAITDYVVQYSSNGGSTWSTFADGVSTNTIGVTVTGLTNGVSYVFRIAAVNSVGTGSYSSASNSVTLTAGATVPGAPTSVTATAGDASATVSWIAPASNGGSAISGYTVQYSSNSGSTWATFAGSTGTATSAIVSGLTNGVGYVFRVAAINSVGTGAFSSSSSAVTPVAAASVPGAPTGVTATGGNGQAAVSWTAPASNGGAAITDYVIQYSSNGGTTWATFADGTSTNTTATVTGLANGTAYVFHVAAVNSVGTGSYSSSSAAVTPTAGTTVPGAPTIMSTTGSAGQAVVSWAAPASNGGAAITDYVVQYSLNAGSTWATFADGTSTATSATVTGLTNGTSYVFHVAAVNSVGTGSYSATSGTVTPAAAGATTLASDTWTGTTGAAWPAQWTTFTTGSGGTATIQANAGRLTSPVGSASYPSQSAYLSGMTSASDTDLLVSFRGTAAAVEQYLVLAVDVQSTATLASNNWMPSTGYALMFSYGATASVSAIDLYKPASNGFTSLQTSSMTLTGTTQYTARFQRVGSAIRARVWATGSAEPSTWAINYTDAAPLAAGKVRLTAVSGSAAVARSFDFNDLTVTDAATTTAPAVTNTVTQSSLSGTTPGGKTVLKYQVKTETGVADRTAFVYMHAGQAPGSTTKLAVLNHGMDGTGAYFVESEGGGAVLTLARQLIDDGYVIIAPTYGDTTMNTFGNAAAQTMFAKAYAYMAAGWKISGTVLVGFSMGGATSLIELHKQTVPGVKVGYIVAGLTDFVSINQTDPSYAGAALISAYNTTSAGLAAATAGYDPMQQPASVWSGMRLRLNYSPQDTECSPGTQGTPFRDKATSGGATVVYTATTGAHTDAAEWESPAGVVTWLDQQLAAGLT